MKKLLLFLFLPLLCAVNAKLNAQNLTGACDISDIVLTVTNPGTTVMGTCQGFTFNVSFTMADNNGNKYVYVESYLKSPQDMYPDYFQCQNNKPGNQGSVKAPVYADIFKNGGPLLSLAIDNSGATPVFLSQYIPDPTVPLTPASSVTKVVLADGSSRFTISGITLGTVNVPCGTPVFTLTDVFSTQAKNSFPLHCVSCGNAFSIGVLNITGLFNCASHNLTLTFTDAITSQLTNVQYTVYADINGNGILDIGTDPVATVAAPPIALSPSTLAGNTPVTNTVLINSAYASYPFIVLATFQNVNVPGSTITNVPILIDNQCIPLPVSIKTFKASRNKGAVDLMWTSATEENNTGFNIQRNTKGNWDNVGFAATKAVNGNSSSDLSYTFSDVNDSKSISQYRLQQVDKDGKYKYSETRSVKGLEQSGKIVVFPTPSSNGQVTVLFEDANAIRDVWVSDMSGRTIKQYKAITNSDLIIDKLKSGFYTIKITNRTTNTTAVEKAVIK